MPVYNFRCHSCNLDIQFTLKTSEKDLQRQCQSCSEALKRVYTSPGKATVMEMGSKYHGRSYRKGMQAVLKKRARDHVIENIGDTIDKHGLDQLKNTSYVNKQGKKRTIWDDK